MTKKYCSHCLPTKRKSHFPFHLEYYLEKAKSPFDRLKWGASQDISKLGRNITTNSLWGIFLEFLSLFKIVRFTSTPDESKLHNLALIFFNEAKKRDIDIKVVKLFGRHLNEFKFRYKRKRYYYESIPLSMQKPSFDVDNKYKVKTLLHEHNVPVPEGKIFISTAKATKFVESIGYPVVVKPVEGSLSWHVICPVKTDDELQRALKIVKKFRPDFIVEKYAEGELHRAAVVGQKHLFISKKEKANVVGDGASTIRVLIEEKNKDERRGHHSKKNTTLYEINVDEDLKQGLSSKGLSLVSVLSNNEKVYLHNKVTLSCGCDIINLSAEAHIKNKQLFLKVSKLLGTNLVGLDIICSDITKPYTEQNFVIIEANSLPHIDMHQNPSHGQESPVAEKIWDVMLEIIDAGR